MRMCRVSGSGLSAYNKIAADSVKIAQAGSFKIFVDNSEWGNYIVSYIVFKDLPGYATYSASLTAYKTVTLSRLCGSESWIASFHYSPVISLPT